MKYLKYQLNLLLTAIMFYTRIPVPRKLEYTPEILNHSTRYFPVIGWIAGIISGGVFFASAMIFPVNLSVAFSMAAGLLVTGAFHEDGLADFFDGFGGGWTKEKILEIMKDSRLGSYGGIALFMALLMKFLILSAVDKSVIPFLMITGHSLSRLTAASFVYTHNYARADETSKVKPIGKGITHAEFIFAAVTGLAPVLLLNNPLFFLLIFPLIPVKMIMGHYMQKWLEGYTGDCLGAVQQVSEIVIYLSYYAIWKFI